MRQIGKPKIGIFKTIHIKISAAGHGADLWDPTVRGYNGPTQAVRHLGLPISKQARALAFRAPLSYLL
jgi:hypothetical protein